MKYAANYCLTIVSITPYIVRGYNLRCNFIARSIIELYVPPGAARSQGRNVHKCNVFAFSERSRAGAHGG
jgi:hypothetical protein